MCITSIIDFEAINYTLMLVVLYSIVFIYLVNSYYLPLSYFTVVLTKNVACLHLHGETLMQVVSL